MKSYIINIYLGEEPDSRDLVGIVEEVGVEGKRGFTNLEELWTIMNSDAEDFCEETASASSYPWSAGGRH
jgi:hypothetical protein